MSYLQFARRYARHVMEQRKLPATLDVPIHRPVPAEWPDTELTVAWLGHATVVMNFFGTWLITDPVLANRIGIRVGGITMGPRRLTRPALQAGELPRLDLILISHAHMDHLDLATLGRFPRDTRVITHRGVSDLLRRFQRVDDIGWGESLTEGGLTVEGVGAKHWGARRIHDQQRGFGGFLLRKPASGCSTRGTRPTPGCTASMPAGGSTSPSFPLGRTTRGSPTMRTRKKPGG